MIEPKRRTLPATTVGAYLVRGALGGARSPTLVGFHGYGQTAEDCMAELSQIPASQGFTLVSVQALSRFYTVMSREVGGCWMTKVDRELAITFNLDYVARVLDAVTSEMPSDGRLVYLGFSQGTSMAYRAAARVKRDAVGVIALGGDVPPELGEDPSLALPRVLIGRGSRDSWYTEEKLMKDVERLRGRGVSVEVALYDGGHEWTPEFRGAAAAFLDRLTAKP